MAGSSSDSLADDFSEQILAVPSYASSGDLAGDSMALQLGYGGGDASISSLAMPLGLNLGHGFLKSEDRCASGKRFRDELNISSSSSTVREPMQLASLFPPIGHLHADALRLPTQPLHQLHQQRIKKLDNFINEGDYYGAQQMYKSISARYVVAQKYYEALDILFSGACMQLKHGQVTCGAELAALFVETLVKGKIPCTDEIIGNVREIYKLFPHMSLPEYLEDEDDIRRLSEAYGEAKSCVDLCSTFLKASIRWSSEFGTQKHGLPELHSMLAEYMYLESPEVDMLKVTHHFVRGKNPIRFASILASFMGKCYPGEDDVAIVRGVLMYLSSSNLRDANRLMEELDRLDKSKNCALPQSELMQFIRFLLQTLMRDALPLFNMLRKSFESSIDREPLFNELMDEIAEKFYGVKRRGLMPETLMDVLKRQMTGTC